MQLICFSVNPLSPQYGRGRPLWMVPSAAGAEEERRRRQL